MGMASGALFGGFSALRHVLITYSRDSLTYSFVFRGGMRGKELVNTVGKVMLQGGGSFGTFLAIGSGLRC